MSLHNGTIYRWNRPVYAAVDGKPPACREPESFRLALGRRHHGERGVLHYGLVRALLRHSPIWTQMSFATAPRTCMRPRGPRPRRACVLARSWRGPAAELILRRLLPLAAEGLSRWGVRRRDADRLLGIVEQRCLTGSDRRIVADGDR
jgi:hypothetical protein